VLLKRLRKLEPFDELNVLILGETGVGKSTFINAFINYLTYDTLAEAMEAKKLEHVVASSFSYQYEDENGEFRQQDIKIGSSPHEKDGTEGQSATQRTAVCRIPLDDGNKIFRLIDTPGIGDTRGVHQDALNIEDILF
jgi:predicted GTPase